MIAMRQQSDRLGLVEVPADQLSGAKTRFELFSIVKDLIPRVTITAYATLNKAATTANHVGEWLDDQHTRLIVQDRDEIPRRPASGHVPLYVRMTGGSTQLKMNVNEVISNHCRQLAGTRPGGKDPLHLSR